MPNVCGASRRLPDQLIKSLAFVLGADLAGVTVRCVVDEPHRGHEAPVPGTSGLLVWETAPDEREGQERRRPATGG